MFLELYQFGLYSAVSLTDVRLLPRSDVVAASTPGFAVYRRGDTGHRYRRASHVIPGEPFDECDETRRVESDAT